jgi:hypothetical protein
VLEVIEIAGYNPEVDSYTLDRICANVLSDVDWKRPTAFILKAQTTSEFFEGPPAWMSGSPPSEKN